MKIHMPSPTSAVGALLYASAGTAVVSIGTMLIHHVHVVIFWS